MVGPGLETLCRLTQVEFLPPGLVGNNVTDVSLISLPLTCLSHDSNKLHWNFSDVRPRGSLWMPSRSNLNSNRRGLPPSPGWDSAEKNCRLKAIGSDQSAGCRSAKQERQMSLIVGLVQASSSRTASCTAQCLEANPVSSIGVLAAQSSATKLPAANGSWGHWPTCPLPKSTLPFVKSLPPFPSSHRRQT